MSHNERKPKLNKTVLVCDFETTVYTGQTATEVWAAASVELFTENVKIFHSIDEQFDYFISLNKNLVCYYHNLKFDGTFWLHYLLNVLHFEQAFEKTGEKDLDLDSIPTRFMENNTFKYSISDMGQWYSITIKVKNKIIEIRDSLKLLPFSVEKIGKSFGTKHKKSSIEYTGFRYAGCEITETEREYIANDVLVVKEALEIMYEQGHDKLTIGSCCLAEFKKLISPYTWDELFPDLTTIEIDKDLYGSSTADEYIRRSYRGGWCYVVKGKENRIIQNGVTADVNSLYPSVMSSESGSVYPVGKPTFWSGNFIPHNLDNGNYYYFIRIRTRFYIKKNKLPFIQIKHSFRYSGNENLETSDIKNPETGNYCKRIKTLDGKIEPVTVDLTLSCVDFKLIQEHYELRDMVILDGCYFHAEMGLFDRYIEKYKKIKLESKGAIRELAKLFLNNLYGKMASNTNSSFKVAYVKDDGTIGFYEVTQNNKDAGFIAVGAAITSYARNFTIRAAQKNYYGSDKRGFIYADTDSIHCDLNEDELIGVPTHDRDFCKWKIESHWDEAIFVRQKTYIEHVTLEDGEPCTPYYNVKCAGMPKRSKELFITSMTGYTPNSDDNYDEDTREWLSTKRELTDFKVGLKVAGKLIPKRIIGGTVLVETTYEMR